ncbi:COG4538 Uncharacterized conserved protein [Rhabdaerophilaceae bacterium]
MQTGIEAEAVVARSLAAFNAKDISALMACWHDDAVILAFPSGKLANGAAEIRARFLKRFLERDLYARLASRASVENTVIDRLIVTRNFPAGKAQLYEMMIYEVAEGRIARAWIKSGTPQFLGGP